MKTPKIPCELIAQTYSDHLAGRPALYSDHARCAALAIMEKYKKRRPYLQERERERERFLSLLSRFLFLFYSFFQIRKQCKKIIPSAGIKPLKIR
jgi:hypothetical protein